jgi:hypothetical protein
MTYREIAANCDDEDAIVIASLIDYHEMLRKPDRVDNSSDVLEPDAYLLSSIERVIKEYMLEKDYDIWLNKVYEEDAKGNKHE